MLQSWANDYFFKDRATNLYNRNYWEMLIMDDAIHYDALVFIDMDNLKAINDDYGHVTGDEAIALVGTAALSQLGDKDIVIRYGGDEFILLLHTKSITDIIAILANIRKTIAITLLDKGCKVMFSDGYAINSGTDSLLELFNKADQAMYQQKEQKYKEIRMQQMRILIQQMQGALDAMIEDEPINLSEEMIMKISRRLDTVILEYYRLQKS